MGASCTKDAGAARGIEAATHRTTTTTTSSSFERLDELDDDLILHILSFVSYAPFERSARVHQNEDNNTEALIQDYNERTFQLLLHNFQQEQPSGISWGAARARQQYADFQAFHDKNKKDFVVEPSRFGTLTHVLPLVNRRLYRILMVSASSSRVWIEALKRNIQQDTSWETGLRDYREELMEKNCGEFESTENLSTTLEELTRQTLAMAQQQMDEDASQPFLPRDLYRKVQEHTPIRLPVFRMAQAFHEGEIINVHLFEPRYRLLIQEVMAHRSDRERSGFPISSPMPRFVWSSFGFATHAGILVEVRCCRLREDGTADVSVSPVANRSPLVALQDVRTRAESGGLQEATLSLKKSPKTATLPLFRLGGGSGYRLIMQNRIALHFFELRYKCLAAEIMKGRYKEERFGQTMTAPLPQFVFVPGNRSMEARIVDVLQCTIHEDGTADLVGTPASWVAIQSVQEKPDTGGLSHATVLLPT